MISRRAFVNGLSVAFVGVFAPGVGLAVGALGGHHVGSATSILVAAVGLSPMRRVGSSLARRLIDAPPDPFERLRAFAVGLSRLPASVEHLPLVAELVAAAVDAESVTVSLEAGPTRRLEVTWPLGMRCDPHAGSVPVVQGGQLLGAITASGLSGAGDSGTGVLLDGIAQQLAPFLRNLILVWDLEALVRSLGEQADQLRDARRRIVAVADRERRRLERDLHDGAQQHLMGLIFRLGVARNVATNAPERLPAVLAELAVMAEGAVAAIVDVGNGAGPRLLREHGLTQALLMHAAQLPVAVDVAVEHVGRHGDDVEAAVYFSCLEALQNVIRHSGAMRVRLALAEREEALEFVVRDDGRGFDAAVCRAGAGLNNVMDRVAAVGGVVHIDSAPGSGTVVSGHVPIETQALVQV